MRLEIETKYNINDWIETNDGKIGVIVAIDVRYWRNLLCETSSGYTYRVSFKTQDMSIDIKSLTEESIHKVRDEISLG